MTHDEAYKQGCIDTKAKILRELSSETAETYTSSPDQILNHIQRIALPVVYGSLNQPESKPVHYHYHYPVGNEVVMTGERVMSKPYEPPFPEPKTQPASPLLARAWRRLFPLRGIRVPIGEYGSLQK